MSFCLMKNRVLTYLRVGMLLHIMSLLEIAIIYYAFPLHPHSRVLSKGVEWWNQAGFIFCLLLPVFAQLDARSRYQNYKQVKDQFIRYGFHSRIVRPFLKSRCQRQAVLVAALELGYASPCKQLFYSSGYRWYHILPDILFANPGQVLTRNFVKTTFFVPTYHRRFDANNSHDPELCAFKTRVKKVKLNDGAAIDLTSVASQA